MIRSSIAMLILAVSLTGCASVRDYLDDWSGYEPPVIEETDDTEPPDTSSDFPDESIWLYPNISRWPITATITNARITRNTIYFSYDKANAWPVMQSRARDGGAMVGTVWAIIEHKGKVYVVSWEHLRKGQQEKPRVALAPSHIKRRELDDWELTSDQRIGLFVSTSARLPERTINERSNIVWIEVE